MRTTHPQTGACVDLYWLPLGAGGHSVRYNGRVYETIVALLERRARCDLYHAALEVTAAHGRYTIESTPVLRGDPALRGVVAGGPVGARWAGRWRLFRYEVRCWPDGVIPDLAEAVDSPRRLTESADHANRILELAPHLPALVWGRDEQRTGEMWNSNSIIAWLLVRAGIDLDRATPPPGGRAPGWRAGVALGRATSVSVVSRGATGYPPRMRNTGGASTITSSAGHHGEEGEGWRSQLQPETAGRTRGLQAWP